jgi:hypothetical protein
MIEMIGYMLAGYAAIAFAVALSFVGLTKLMAWHKAEGERMRLQREREAAGEEEQDEQ